MSKEPILKLPDLERPFIVQTDASNETLGACLLQEYEGVKHPVMYASKKLLPREQNYSVGEREALAIILAVNKFHRFLYGINFVIETLRVTFGLLAVHAFEKSALNALEFGFTTISLYSPLY